MALLGPVPRTEAGTEHRLVIVDCFSKMTRAIPLLRIDAQSIAAACLDHWVPAYGPPATVLSEKCPQFRFTFFQGVCSLLWIADWYSTTHHPQTNGQVERYNRTIVGQLRTYVEDHQDRWDALLSIQTPSYNSLPQQSSWVAPLKFLTHERVRNLSVVGPQHPRRRTVARGVSSRVSGRGCVTSSTRCGGPSRWHSGSKRGATTLV